jgi:hypothetical protein
MKWPSKFYFSSWRPALLDSEIVIVKKPPFEFIFDRWKESNSKITRTKQNQDYQEEKEQWACL